MGDLRQLEREKQRWKAPATVGVARAVEEVGEPTFGNVGFPQGGWASEFSCIRLNSVECNCKIACARIQVILPMSGISWSPATTEVDADSHLFNIEDLKEAGLAHAEARRVLKECRPGPHVRSCWLDKPVRRQRCRRYLVAQVFKQNIGPHHGLCVGHIAK